MSTTLRQDVDFHGLFKKLGHHLEEIRLRALENILSKLEHKLVCDSDLIQERHLFIRLLEWFNFPKSTRHADVLNLILQLSQHTAAAEILQDIGGIEFLTNLRKDLSSALQPIIDQILENTMRLPEVQLDQHAPECIYQKHNHTGTTVGHETTMESAVTRHTHEQTCNNTGMSHHTAEKGRLPDYREPPLGFFEGDPGPAVPVAAQPGSDGIQEPASCFRMTTFPWLALTPTDRHVIVSTNTSLQSREPSLLVSTCEFLSDVVFQDFPAEIFLQRPNIIKNLMSLLAGQAQDMDKPRIHATRALADYVVCLRCRIKSYQDPNLYTAKQDFSSTPSAFSTPSSASSANAGDVRPSVIGWTDTRHRGDGRDGDTSGSSSRSEQSSVGFSPELEQENVDFEDMPSLQYIQMTIPQFCATVVEKALPLLKTSDEYITTEVFHLLHQVLEIILMVMTPDLWEDSSMAAREVIDKLTESFDVIADLLKYHHHNNMPFDLEESEHQGQGDLVQHRLVYIGISVFMTKLLKALVPVEKCRGVIPESLLSAINMLVYDEPLSDSDPDPQLVLLGYLQQQDRERYDLYVATATICQSMQKTCKFMMLCQEEASRLSKETLSLSEGAFKSLPFHSHLQYITENIQLCVDTCTKSQHYEGLQQQYRKLLMKFMSHPVPKIRQHTYSTVLHTVQSCLSVAKATDPGSTSCEKIKFLINSDLLYEIIVFGLADKDAKVSSTASDLVSHLLKSQLLMTPDLWQSFLTTLLRGLPILQSYAGLNTVLGNTLLSMLEPRGSESANELSQLEKFRGALRCMLSTDLKVRSESLKRLSWYLSNEENSSRKLPVFSELDVTNLANVFIVDTPRSVDEDLGRSVFQVDGLRKVYEIFTSLTVDPGVKKSAIDQLAIILQDNSLHSAFKKDGGIEKILEHIQLGIHRDGESNTNSYMQYLPGCMTVLRHLVHHDYSLRHKLAHDSQVYHSLLRVALLHTKDERTCYEVSHLLTLLLFDEQARFYMGGTKNTAFSVPNVVKLRFRLPFRPATHYEKSPNQVAPLPYPDPLQTGLPLEMLRISWNMAWHGGMDNLLKSIIGSRQQAESLEEFSAKLKLIPTDKVLLTTSNIKHGLQNSVHKISNATSHQAVSVSLTRLLSHLVARYNSVTMTAFHTLDWCNTLGRFVMVTPSSAADESLLLGILRFISLTLKLTNRVPDNILQWVGEVLYHPKGPLIGLLHRQSTRETTDDVSETLVNIKRSLDKSLLSFISAYNSSLPYVLCVRLKFHELRGDLARKLLQRLNITDAPHFYNLASLEGTLQCLMHITARPGWSEECTEQESSTLCAQVLNCLLDVISAFHIGRGGTSMSYMGKGVTKAATLCLRHLVYEMATTMDDKTWPQNWLYSRHGNDIPVASEVGLDWLLTLWAYRDAEVSFDPEHETNSKMTLASSLIRDFAVRLKKVRAAGLGLAVTLTSTHEGRLLVNSNCKHIPGGVWGAAFSILLDQSECSMVRQQAALLLVNLTSQSLPTGPVEEDQTAWQGPVVMDAEYKVSLTGLTALLALLNHCQFYREMLILLSSYYPQPTVQPTVINDLIQLSASSSENTMSMLTDGGLAPRTGSAPGSILQGISLLQSSAVSSSRIPERLGAVGANGQPSLNGTGTTTNITSTSAAAAGKKSEGKSSSEEPARETTEHQSITTPCLVSAVSQLVRNLIIMAPKDSVASLKNESLIPFFVSMIDAGFLEGIQVLTSSDELELFFTELVQMHCDILRLLQTCLVHDASTRIDILGDKVSLGGIVSLLRIYSDVSEDTRLVCGELWETVLSFLKTLVQLQSGPGLEVLSQVLHKQWNPIAENLLSILESDRSEDKQLYMQCLHFLSVVCSEEGKLQMKRSTDDTSVSMTTLLNLPLQTEVEDKDSSHVTAGARFCKALISSYDQWILRKSDACVTAEKVHVVTSLKCLLAVAQSAKSAALESGLIENLIEHVKQTHAKLNMSSLQVGKPTLSKGKDEPIVQELILTFDLLRNFMYQSEAVKLACYHSGLHGVVHKLWSWCQIDTALMTCVISLLTTYTSLCPSATSSLAFTTSSSSTAPVTQKSSLGPNSLAHCLMKYVAKDNHKEGMLKSLFGLLCNLAMSSECINIIWKSNFLGDFANLNPKKSKKGKSKLVSMETLWLELLVNLSFSMEGQQMILKISDSVDILMEFMDCSQSRHQECATLIIRNICCHANNKPKVLANEKLIPRLLQCVNSGSDKLQTIAASALWALVYNNQKAKVIMKNANILPKLQDTLNCIDDHPESNLADKCYANLQAVIATVSE